MCIDFEDVLAREQPAAVHRADPVRRGRVLDVHLRLDRRPQGRQARPHHADGGGAPDGAGRHRHPRGRRGVLGGEAVLLLRPRQRHGVPDVGRRDRPCCCRTGRRPRRVFELMRRHRPTIFYAVPTLYAALLAHKDMTRGAGSDRLRLCVSAGEALPAHVGERWRAVAGCDVLDGIGSTEMFQTFLSNRPDDVRYGSTGKAGARLRTQDRRRERPRTARRRDRRARRARAVGRRRLLEPARQEPAHLRGRMDLYRRQVSARSRTATITTAGAPTTCSRCSGMWVSPFEVEAALASHEAVLEAAVIGKQDADGLIKPKAFIVLKNGYAADDGLLETLKVHVKERAGPWKYPRWIECAQTCRAPRPARSSASSCGNWNPRAGGGVALRGCDRHRRRDRGASLRARARAERQAGAAVGRPRPARRTHSFGALAGGQNRSRGVVARRREAQSDPRTGRAGRGAAGAHRL